MTTIYQKRIDDIVKYPFMTGAVPSHGINNPISDLLGEYYRRVSRFQSPPRSRLPPELEHIVEWFGSNVTHDDLDRVARDSAELTKKLKARRVHVSITMRGLIKAILLWSLLVDRGVLSLDDDPSVPMLAIFEAGYSLDHRSHGLEIWGEIPWTIEPADVFRRAGLLKD